MKINVKITVKEIERKFLVNPIYWEEYLDFINLLDFYRCEIHQYYLPIITENNICTVERLRAEKFDNVKHIKYYHFIKTNLIGDLRNRTETIIPLSKEEYDNLLSTKFKTSNIIEKYRYSLPLPKRDEGIIEFIVDTFNNSKINYDFMMFEIEFKNEDFANKFDPTKYPFLGLEVTNDIKYTNAYLAKPIK